MNELTIATTNRGKLREFSFLFSRFLPAFADIKLRCIADFKDAPVVIEDGSTFHENARKKALEIANYTGSLTLADDSGLAVDYLDGAPGIYSARYASENASDDENNMKLLEKLKNVDKEDRSASFICVIALALPNDLLGLFEGVCRGTIGTEPQGGNGFGFDPLFIRKDYGMTFAELPQNTKNAISHRARAFEKAAVMLQRYLPQLAQNDAENE